MYQWLLFIVVSAHTDPIESFSFLLPNSNPFLRESFRDFSLNTIKSTARIFDFDIVRNYTHPIGFTQGLAINQNKNGKSSTGNTVVLESTGLNGLSTLRELRIQNKIENPAVTLSQLKPLPVVQNLSLFAEDLTILKGRIYQLTYKSGIFLIYSARTFALEQVVKYPTQLKEGWGLTNDGDLLYVSDGTANIHILRPSSNSKGVINIFHIRTIIVRDAEYEEKIISGINALTFAHTGVSPDTIWANIYGTSCLVQISVSNGIVIGWISIMRGPKHSSISPFSLYPDNPNPKINIMNGVAFQPTSDAFGSLFVTGKNWPYMFQLKLYDLQHELKDILKRETIQLNECYTTLDSDINQ